MCRVHQELLFAEGGIQKFGFGKGADQLAIFVLFLYLSCLFDILNPRSCLTSPAWHLGCFLGGFLHLGLPGMSTQQSRVDHVTRSEPDDKKIETLPFKSYNLKKQYKTIKIISTSTQAIQILKKKNNL